MKLKDVKIGGKYVPHSKTVRGFGELDECNHWRDAKDNNQPFLYCVGIEGAKVVLNWEMVDNGRGNYYYASDLSPYQERLKLKDIVVGEKYVPLDKTVGCGLSESVWNQGKEQGYLFCTRKDLSINIIVLNECMDGSGDYFAPEDLVRYVPKEASQTFEVDVDFIKEAHSAASLEWKEKLKDKFPEVFVKQPIEFKEGIEINKRLSRDDLPFAIGDGIAPVGKSNKCLMIDSSRWEMITSNDSGYIVLEFVPKF